MGLSNLGNNTPAAAPAPTTKKPVRWVGDPTTGHWVDEDGNAVAGPNNTDQATIDARNAATEADAKRKADALNGTKDPLHAWADSDQSSGTDPFHNPDKGVTVDGKKPAGAPPPVVAGPSRSEGVADRAKQLADDAAKRVTDPGVLGATTADPKVADRTGTWQPTVTPDYAGRTAAPDQVHVDPITGTTIGSQTIGAQTVAGPNVNHYGQDLQSSAAKAYEDVLNGKTSLAELQLKSAQDRAAAEQLSIAAGARGQGVASARRNAATNVGLQQMQAGGQMAELRAKELADAAAGLGNIGASIQGNSLVESGQTIDVGKANASNDLSAQTTNAGNKLSADKSNQATDLAVKTQNQNTDKEVKLEHTKQQLTADLASDDRLQSMLNKRADLAAAANAGNQNAAVQLNALDANLGTEIARFNAQQIQTANSTNIEARLRAIGMDDQHVAQMTQLWIQAEANHDQARLEQLKIQLQAEANARAKKGDTFNFISGLLGTFGTIFGGPIGGAIGKGIGSLFDGGGDDSGGDDTFGSAARYDSDGNLLDANGNPIVMSDERLKKNIKRIDPKDIDGFLRAIGNSKTWEYKDGDGERKMGPMAQDMRADKLARDAVSERSDGMMGLDYQKLAALAMAGLGRLNDRVEAIEVVPTTRKKPDVTGFLRRGR